MEIQLFQYLLLKRLLSPLNVIGTLIKNQLTIGVSVYFWTLDCIPLIYMCILMPVPCCFDQYTFVVSFGIVKYYSSNFVVHFQGYFGYAGSFGFPHEF